MKFYRKLFFFAVTSVLLIAVFTTCAFGAENNAYMKLCDNKGGIMSVARRGDTSLFPGNSLEAVESACKKGADMISISVAETADGVLVLCENKALPSVCDTDVRNIGELTEKEALKLKLLLPDMSVSDCKLTTLKKALSKVKNKSILILDNCWEYRSDIYELCQALDAFESVIIRTDVSSKQIVKFCSDHPKLSVIGIYDGNIVFNAQSHLKRLSQAGQSAVQFQSKNYFNVMYHSFTARKYSSANNARAIAPMYDMDLSGQREDNVTGWNEIIDRGFSVIETDCIDLLEEYILQCDQARQLLELFVAKADKTQLTDYSQVSFENFSKALSAAKSSLADGNASLGRLQQDYSALCSAYEKLTLNTDTDVQRGSFNITAGKAAAVIIFGSLIIAGEIYVHKMHAPRRKERVGRKH